MSLSRHILGGRHMRKMLIRRLFSVIILLFLYDLCAVSLLHGTAYAALFLWTLFNLCAYTGIFLSLVKLIMMVIEFFYKDMACQISSINYSIKNASSANYHTEGIVLFKFYSETVNTTLFDVQKLATYSTSTVVASSGTINVTVPFVFLPADNVALIASSRQ